MANVVFTSKDLELYWINSVGSVPGVGDIPGTIALKCGDGNKYVSFNYQPGVTTADATGGCDTHTNDVVINKTTTGAFNGIHTEDATLLSFMEAFEVDVYGTLAVYPKGTANAATNKPFYQYMRAEGYQVNSQYSDKTTSTINFTGQAERVNADYFAS